jgi:hypothetical protein
MSQKMAVCVSAALTVFVLIVAGGLAVRLGGLPPAAMQAVEPAPAARVESEAVASPATLDVLIQREQRYRQQMEEANSRLQAAYHDMRALQAQLQRLQTQNATLTEREHTYQQRLQEANRLLQQRVASTPLRPIGPASQGQEADSAEDAGQVVYTKANKAKRERHHDNAYGKRERAEEDDDD